MTEFGHFTLSFQWNMIEYVSAGVSNLLEVHY